jgi:type VI secretion system secreted protein VgrG
MTIAQANRQLRIKTPLGKDKLLLYQLQAQETLGRLFEYQVELLSEDDAIPLDALLGKKVDIELGVTHGGIRTFNAFVSHFSQVGIQGELFHYQARLRPWPWLLSLTSDCRIYQNLTVPQILTEIFNENGFNDYDLRLSNPYRTWEYCVQFRETDFNFISRLMEEEGIYYYFEHTPGKHTLVLCDNYGSHNPLSDESVLPFQPDPGAGGQRGKDIVRRWSMSKSVQSGCYAHTDYDFKKPRSELLATSPMPRSHPHANYELFHYPGSYEQIPEGEGSARHRIEEVQARYEQLQGEGDIRHLTVGGLFTLKDHPRDDQNREYLITETNVEMQADPYLAGNLVSLGETYRCVFTCIPSVVSYRTPRTTPKPRVEGPQTAVVVGPKGKEIYSDEYGRVKVQFHWDRYGESNENSSCWVRVAQVWAGKNWGAIHVPRIGQEVIVEFLDGDPDRPIITGRVYNAEQMPPWRLPTNQTQSGILSRSTKGGTVSNANAIRFEDKKGDEQLWLHAEKDQLSEVENDETKWVGNDRSKSVDANETMTIGINQTITIGDNQNVSIGSNQDISIGANQDVTIGGNQTETVALSKVEEVSLTSVLGIGSAYQVTVGGAMNTTVGMGQGEEIGLAKHVLVGKNYDITVGDEYGLSAENSITLQLNDDEYLNIAKGDNITLKTGPSLMVMEKSGNIALQEGDSLLLIDNEKIVLQVGDNLLQIDNEGIVLQAGESQKEMKKDGTINLSGSLVSLLGSNRLKLNC